jgi:hypothetical protein
VIGWKPKIDTLASSPLITMATSSRSGFGSFTFTEWTMMNADDVPTPEWCAFIKTLTVLELAALRKELKNSGDTFFVTAIDIEFRRREQEMK